MREIQAWNMGWEYVDICTEGFLDGDVVPGAQEVALPHSNCEIPHNYFDEGIYQKLCGYRRRFDAPSGWAGKTTRLVLEAAAHEATVFLNGWQLARHEGGYTAFEVDLTPALLPGGSNLLVVRVDSRESLNMPPFGGVIDYMTFGGLCREARLEITGPGYIGDVFAHTPDVLGEVKQLHIQTTLVLPNGPDGLSLRHRVLEGEALLAERSLPAGAGPVQAALAVQNAALWNLESPKLYILRTGLYRDGALLDEVDTNFGFRSVRFEKDGFYLNDKRVKLRGLNRHQSWPNVGYAMPARPQRLDADICKYELGLNAVRTSHYPQNRHFIDRCDEIGLLVFTELPGWQHIGDEEWKDVACQSVREMVLQYRNHPSIVLWGVRINESRDDDLFYARTNQIAHELDPSRQTSGVRFIQKSHLLEDVYGYNDFSHSGANPGVEPKSKVTPDREKPYLITEYNGHMFPTKTFDWEGRRLEHALRHARVMDGYYGSDEICGGFGWCLFDYHTHRDFGSGDRICYHGVLDMHRGEKLAAAVYKSQAEGEPVLEISSSMDIGEHPVGYLGTIYAFTNAQSVRVYKNDDYIGEFFPDREAFPHLPHPPMPIDDLVGGLLVEKEGLDHKAAEVMKELMTAIAMGGLSNLSLPRKLLALYYMKTRRLSFEEAYRIYSKYMGNWGGEATSYRFEALRAGRVVKTVIKEPVRATALEARADTRTLAIGDSYDVSTVRLRAVDQNGNTLSLCMEPVALTVTGPLELIGPATVTLRGGLGGAWLKTTGQAGKANLTLDAGHIGRAELDFTVEDGK